MVKSNYRITHAAKFDLSNIWDYTEEKWGTRQAETYLKHIKKQFEILALSPEKGRARNDIYQYCRSFPVEKHIIIYRTVNSYIDIIRVLHQSMDIESHINQYIN